ncbi:MULTISPECIES: HD domain-containing protein [Thermomicrobium]|jgi:putative nucleotidyltransferase with HDIG domain|uniref:HD domain-containing protein n=1 Tax=Thermomicrobium TaxID=499 RepID=UPI00059BD19E|nr:MULTISPECIES: HD domain-containing protein [Thermomicrobium]MBO9306088.1 HDIG domain-containing protein [Thermomicrobium sp.]MBO9405324.1 HDIG domain-containing protein [Thermomicrobium sp.]
MGVERSLPTREEAWQLVREFTSQPHLLRHMRAVEAAMRAYARRFGENEELWGLVGILHDFDYERYPDISTEGHPVVGARILRERGYPEEVIRAILAHASEVTGVEPESLLEKTLVAVDELTGFLVAVALVRPTKSILDVEVSSVKKKWKAKEFAAAVNRQEIERAAAALGVPLEEHIRIVLDAMKEIAHELGLERRPVEAARPALEG